MSLEIDDIHISYGKVRAVDGVTLTLPTGGRLGVIGPNGSGKSTLINAISGAVTDRGTITIDGHRLRGGSQRAAAHAGISRTYQTPQTFTELSCIENVMLGLGPGDKRTKSAGAPRERREHRRTREALALLDEVGLLDLAETSAAILTYGQQQMLGLARALATNPLVLLLDEPAAGLNTAETEALSTVLDKANARGVALLLVEHKMDFVTKLCPRIAVLSGGKLVADGPHAEVLADPRVVDAYLGAPSNA
jgi:branched-chain amino acid transport system ATP-binding protein